MRVADDGVDPVALGDVAADQGVRALHLVVDRLADVVQQAALLGLGHVGADLGRQQPGQARDLDEWLSTFWP